jgi:hypothetical protein
MTQLESIRNPQTGTLTVTGQDERGDKFSVIVRTDAHITVEFPERKIFLSRFGKLALQRRSDVPDVPDDAAPAEKMRRGSR